MLELELPWGRQPQEAARVDHRHPLARNLRLRWAFGGWHGRDAVGNFDLGDPLSLGVTDRGKVWTGGRGLTTQTGATYSAASGAPITVAAVIRTRNSDTSLDAICRLGYPSTAGTQLVLYANVVSAGDFYVGTYSNDIYTVGGTLQIGQWTVVMVSYAGGEFSTSKVYVNGALRATTPAGSGGPLALYSPAQTISLAGDVTAGREFRGDIAVLDVWDRALSAAEATLYARNQYAIFAPRCLLIPVSAASSDTGAITPAAGASTTSTIVGASSAAATPSAAAGAATTATMGGASTAAASITPAAGTSTAATLAGVAGAGSIITPAAGAATASTMAGASSAAASITAAAGASTAGTLAGVAGSSGSAITPAAGASTPATLVGSSTAAASITPAQGQATAAILASNGGQIIVPDLGGGNGRARRLAEVERAMREQLQQEEEEVMMIVSAIYAAGVLN